MGVHNDSAQWSHRHVVLESEDDFHKQLATLFLFVTGRGDIANV